MQIACPACAATYEFDESRVGAEGIALRCSACGHLFQYARLTAAAVDGLRVRRSANGEVLSFSDPLELRRAILERRFQRGDLLSRSGTHWAALGDSTEFAPYFQVAEEMGGVAARPSPPLRMPQPGQTRELDAVIGLDVVPSSPNATRGMYERGATGIGAAAVAADTDKVPPSLARSAPMKRPPPAPLQPPGRPRLDTDELRAARAAGRGGYSLGPLPGANDREEYVLGGQNPRRAAGDTGPIFASGKVRRDVASSEQIVVKTSGNAGIPIAIAIVVSTCLVLWFALPAFRHALLGVFGASAPEGSGAATVAMAPAPTEVVAGEPVPTAADTATDGSAVPDAGEVEVAAIEPQAPDGPPTPAQPAPDAAPATTSTPVAAAAPVGVAATGGAGYDSLMRRGNDALGAGQLETALAAFSDAADRFDRAEAHVGMARTYQRMGRTELARIRFERATEANSRYQPAWIELGDILRSQGDAAGARAAYERVLAIRDAGTAADRARAGLEALGAP